MPSPSSRDASAIEKSGPLFLALTLLVGASPATAAPPEKTAAPAESGTALDRGVLDAKAGLPGRWRRELAERQAALAGARGRSLAGIVGLMGILGELRGEIPEGELAGLLDEVGKDKRRHPLQRAYAAYLRAKLHESAGEGLQAQAIYAEQGFLTDWSFVGPFDNAGRRGPTTAYPPELRPYDPNQTFDGKLATEPVAWRRYDQTLVRRGAYVSFDELLRPNVDVVAYATTWVKADDKKSTKATLHLGTGGPYQVWIGQTLAGEGDAYRSPDPLQDAWDVELAPGWNRIMVKVSAEEGAWGFYARLGDRSGGSLASIEVSAEPGPDAPLDPPRAKGSVKSGASEVEPVPAKNGVRNLMEAKAEGKRAKAVDQVALTHLYRWTHPLDRDDDTEVAVARRADEAAKTAESAWLLALLDPDQNDSRRALVAGIARAEKAKNKGLAAEMLLELAWRYDSLGLRKRARETLLRAQAAAPDDALIEMSRVDQLSGDGFPLAALKWTEDLEKRYPDSRAIATSKAERLIDLGRADEGLAILERLSSKSADAGLVARRVEVHMARAETDKAVALGERLVDGSPGLPSVHRELARLYEADGRTAEALTALDRALKLSPQDAALHAERGHLLARTGSRDASILSYQRSLELNPQQPDLRDRLATLGARGGADIFDRHAVDLEKVAKAAKGKEDPTWTGKEAAVLHRTVAVKVAHTGLGERLDHRIIKILDDRGIRNQSVQAIAFDPAESYVDVRRARVRRASGEIEEIGKTQMVSLAAAGYRMFYDQRQVRVSFPGLRVGDVLEVAFVKRDVAARNMFDDYFGDMVPLQDSLPIRTLEYVLEAPSDMKLYFNQKVERKAEKDRDAATYTLRREKVPGFRGEASMPGWTEVAEYLHVSTYGNWDDVATWYWGLVEEQLLVDDEIRAGVTEALADLPKNASERDKIDALYRHVITKTRYVGLEFGIHGYKPYRTTDIYDRRFGDCKDKASLLKVMLAEIGIDSNLVLVRTRDQGTIGDSPASLSAFNHAIVYVPGHDIFLDGTAEFSGANELPANDQGASVLVVKDGKGGQFRTIPFSKPGDNVSATAQEVTLAKDGSAKVKQSMTITGAAASTWRYRFQSADDRIEKLTKLMGGRYPGTKVTDAAFPGIGDVLKPVTVETKLEVPRWGEPQGGALRYRATGQKGGFVRSLAPQVKREHPLVLNTPLREERSVRYRLPRGMTFTTVPEAKTIDGKHGRFSLQVTHDGASASVNTVLELRQNRIPAGEYADFRNFLQSVDAALEQAFEASEER